MTSFLRAPWRRALLTLIAVIALLPLSISQAAAAPADEAGTTTVRPTGEGTALVTIDTGSLTVEDDALVVRDARGELIESVPLTFLDGEGVAYPIKAEATGSKSVALTRETGRVLVDKDEELASAKKQFQGQAQIGTTIGSLVGLGLGFGAGCAIGIVFGAIVGCVAGGPIGAGLGAMVGAPIGGAIGAENARQSYEARVKEIEKQYKDKEKAPSTQRAGQTPQTQQPRTQQTPNRQGTAPQSNTYYKNCDEARDAGVAPIREGDPGYRSGLDRDGDGIACEPKR